KWAFYDRSGGKRIAIQDRHFFVAAGKREVDFALFPNVGTLMASRFAPDEAPLLTRDAADQAPGHDFDHRVWYDHPVDMPVAIGEFGIDARCAAVTELRIGDMDLDLMALA